MAEEHSEVASNVNDQLTRRLDELGENVNELYAMEDDPDPRARTVATALDEIHIALCHIVSLIEVRRDGS